MAKIEVVKQLDVKDCGACSLSCIIKYYDGYVPLEKIRIDTCTNQNGTTAFHIITAAESYGFDVMGVKIKSLDDKNIYLPAIAHVILKNGLNHFVVIYKMNKNDVWLMDPAKGKVKMKRTEFESIWDNVLILLTPVTKIIKTENQISMKRTMINLVKQDKRNFITICILNIVLTIVTIASSFYVQIAVSQIDSNEYILIMIFFFFFHLTLSKIIITYVKNYYHSFFDKNIDVLLYSEVLNHIFHLPSSFIDNRTTGEITSRVTELGEIKSFLSDAFTSILLNSILMIGAGIALYMISSKLLMILLICLLLYSLVGMISSKEIYEKVRMSMEAETDFNTTLVENIEMNGSIKNLNSTKIFLRRLEKNLIAMLKRNFLTIKFINNAELLKNLIYEVGVFIVTTYGIYLILQNELSLLSFITFNSLILYLSSPTKEIIDLIPRYNYLKASFIKLSEFLNVETEQEKSGLQEMNDTEIEFQNVTYSYNKLSNIIENLSFKIEKSEKVLLVGTSGSGKTTVCHLLKGGLEGYNGIITIGHVNLKDYDIKTLRENILMIGQNEKLFSGSIKENIIAGRNVDEKEYLNVLKICEIESIVKNRPNRYDTLINASFNNLSGGERQRIILARALLKKSKIMILDEALSEVNIDLECKIIENIKINYQDCTLIYISHKNVKSHFDRLISVKGSNV